MTPAVRADDEPRQPLILLRLDRIPHDAEDIETRQDGLRKLHVCAEGDGGVVPSADRVGGGDDTTAGLESGDDAAFVFEDDASIPRKSVDARVLVGVPSDWDVVLLGCHGVQGSGLAGEFRRIRRFVGLHAYAISASGAHKVLSAPVFPLVMQIDAYLSWMALRGKLKIYATRYNVVNQRVTKSDIQSLHVTQNSIWLGRYGFEHEPEEGGSEGLLSKNRATLEALKPNWTEIRPFKDAMGSVELRASSWTWTPWGR